MEPLYLEKGRPGDASLHLADIGKARRLLGYWSTGDVESSVEQHLGWLDAQDIDLEDWAKQERPRTGSIQSWQAGKHRRQTARARFRSLQKGKQWNLKRYPPLSGRLK